MPGVVVVLVVVLVVRRVRWWCWRAGRGAGAGGCQGWRGRAPGVGLRVCRVWNLAGCGWGAGAGGVRVGWNGVRVLEVWRKCGACWWKFCRGAGVRVLVEILGGRCCAL